MSSQVKMSPPKAPKSRLMLMEQTNPLSNRTWLQDVAMILYVLLLFNKNESYRSEKYKCM